MNIMGCLDTPTRGEYLLNGIAVAQMSDTELAHVRNRAIGFMFQTFHLLVELFGFGGGLANRPNVRPSGMARYHPQVPYHWDPLARHGLNNPRAGGAIDGAGTEFQGMESDADGILPRRQPMRG